MDKINRGLLPVIIIEEKDVKGSRNFLQVLTRNRDCNFKVLNDDLTENEKVDMYEEFLSNIEAPLKDELQTEIYALTSSANKYFSICNDGSRVILNIKENSEHFDFYLINELVSMKNEIPLNRLDEFLDILKELININVIEVPE